MRDRYLSRAIKLFTCAFLVVLMLQTNEVAKADIAPPEPPNSSNPMAEVENTNVRMVSETVIMEIDADSPYDESLAQVTAVFTMRNLSEIEEQMDVRFPLAQSEGWGYLCTQGSYVFDPITDLKAWVDNRQVATYKTYETLEFFDADSIADVTRTVPCWEHFEVTFPPGEDVIIKVTYTATPYDHWKSAYYGYSYILETGAGWKGTIGSADIIVRLPYELNEYNFIACRPETCTVDSNEIRWHDEDFEPDYHSNVSVSLLPPHLWQRILVETENTTKNPDDGEAWGRLGKAYKESIKAARGFRSDAPGDEMYSLSKDAYQNAITLLPDDADWHYGFAELLCWKAEWESEKFQKLVDCFEQLKQVLEINPEHKRANELLRDSADIYQWEDVVYELVDLSGPEPDYLILTYQPSATATKIQPSATSDYFPQATVTDELMETRTPEVTKTPKTTSTATQPPEPEATQVVDNTLTPIVDTDVVEVPSVPTENTGSNWPIYIGSVLVLVIVVAIIMWRRK